MNRWQVVIGTAVLIFGMWGGAAFAQAPGQGEPSDGASRTRVATEPGLSAEKTEQAAGSMTLVEPGADGVSYELSAHVWMGLKDVKGAACFSFDIERTATETTVTAYCFAGKGKGKAWGNFEVDVTVWQGHSGVGVDSCQKRQNLKQNPVFVCTVQNPDEAAATE